MFGFLLYGFAKMFCIAMCPSIHNSPKLTMFDITMCTQCLNFYIDNNVNLCNEYFSRIAFFLDMDEILSNFLS